MFALIVYFEDGSSRHIPYDENIIISGNLKMCAAETRQPMGRITLRHYGKIVPSHLLVQAFEEKDNDMSFFVNDTSSLEPHKEFEKINENNNLRIESTINEAIRIRWESYDDVTCTLFSFIASTESTQKNVGKSFFRGVQPFSKVFS